MSYLERVYKRTIETGLTELGSGRGMDIWQWDQGVAMAGFIKAYEKTEDRAIIDFIKKWMNYHLDKIDFGYSINTTAPLIGVVKLLELEPGNGRYEKICDSFAEWCMAKAPRADRGSFEHSCTENKYDNQVWADTLFMGCLFLLRFGLYRNCNIYIEEVVRQFILHYKFLADDKTGLIYHGYDCNERVKKGVLWGRGNGWFAAASSEVLSILPAETEGYKQIYDNFKRHLDAAVRFQSEEGGWHTVMDRDDTYIEMSVTAAFAYALNKAAELGLSDPSYKKAAERAESCLIENIDEKGNVLKGSGGTCVMSDYLKYNDIPCTYSYFTQGLAMMALIYE